MLTPSVTSENVIEGAVSFIDVANYHIYSNKRRPRTNVPVESITSNNPRTCSALWEGYNL